MHRTMGTCIQVPSYHNCMCDPGMDFPCEGKIYVSYFSRNQSNLSARMRLPGFQVIVFLSLWPWKGISGQDPTRCCDVVAFEAIADSGTWAFYVSMSSLYERETGLSKWCNFFEVRAVPADGSNYTVLGKRDFGHDHPYEQPFTRAIRDEVLPDGTIYVIAIAHDSVDGYCGRSQKLSLSANTPTSITASPTMQPPSPSPISVLVSPAPVETTMVPAVPSQASAAPVPPTFPTLNPKATNPSSVSSAPDTPPPTIVEYAPSSILPSFTPSDLPSFTPSDLPSYLPSSIPSDGPSRLSGGPASSASAFGLCIASAIAVAAASACVSL